MRSTSIRLAITASTLTIFLCLATSLSGESAYFATATTAYVEELHAYLNDVATSGQYESSFTSVSDAAELLNQLAKDCDQYGTDCQTAHRILIGVSDNDLLSAPLTKHLGRALEESIVDPSDDGITYLPKPYPYMNLTKAATYLVNHLRPEDNPLDTFRAEPPPTRELSYTPGSPPSRPFDSSALAGALTDFLINRASQELLHSISRSIQTTDSAKTLIPAMASFLSHPSAIQLDTIIPAFRSAAAEDIQKLPARLLQFAPDGEATVYDRAYDTLELIRNGLRPAVAFARFVSNPSSSQKDSSAACNSLDIIGRFAHEWIVSRLPAGKTTVGGFTRIALHERLRSDDDQNDLFNRYMNVLFGNIRDKCFHKWEQYESGHQSSILSILNFVDQVFLRLVQIDTLIAEATEPSTLSRLDGSETPASRVLVSRVLQLTVDLIQFVDGELSQMTLSRSIQDGALASLDRGNSGTDEALGLWMQMYRSALEQRYTDTVSYALRYINRVPDFEEDTYIAAVAKLINLGANLIEAETSEEFKSVLYAATEPVGSYVTKRQIGSHVTLGAYVGAIAGGERIQGPGGDAWQGHVGVALPVGIEFSWGYSHGIERESNCCSFGIFVSPLDFGLVANYRVEGLFGRATSTEPAQIGWQQIFAPSIYLVLGLFEDIPLAVAGGLQYAPQARVHPEIEDPVDALRLSIMVAIDVTLFRL